MHASQIMKRILPITILLFTVFFQNFSTASVRVEKWLSPWESFEEAFPRELSLARRLSIEESWNRGFEELEKYSLLNKSWTAEHDRILFLKITEILEKFGDEISLERIPQFKLYLQNRIKRFSAAAPEDVIHSYYFYLNFYPEDKRIESVFSEPFANLTSDFVFNTDGEAELFLHFLQNLAQQKKQIPLSYFKILMGYCENFNTQSKTKTKALLTLLNLFNTNDEQLKLLTMNEWDNLLFQRHQLFKNYRKNKLSEAINKTLLSSGSLNLYIHHILLQNKLWAQQLSNINLKWTSPEVQQFVELSKTGLRDQLSSNSPKENYQILFSQIEILKGLLDLRLSLDIQNAGVIGKNKREDGKIKRTIEEKWYQKLRDFHIQALGYLQLTQYSTSLIFQCYEQNANTKTCQSFRDYLPFRKTHTQSIEKFGKNNERMRYLSTEWNINEPYIYFPAGRYEFEPNASIYLKADRIEFHPLALIYAPSGSVTVDSLELDSPWIDVSGREEIQIPHMISSGKRPWIKDSKHCRSQQYIEGATLVSIPKKNCRNKIEEGTPCIAKPEWTLFTVINPYPNVIACSSHAIDPDKNLVGDLSKMLDMGVAPEEPSSKEWINQTNGLPGGNITITVQDQILSPLLLAQGGNGISGSNGQSSPLCDNENQFHSYKLIISLPEDEYARWIENSKNNPYVQITPLQSEIYHRIALFEILLPRTSGSDGGSGGEGGQLKFNLPLKMYRIQWKHKSYFVSGGIEGLGGNAGECGPNVATNGKMGLRGAPGQYILNKNAVVSRP